MAKISNSKEFEVIIHLKMVINMFILVRAEMRVLGASLERMLLYHILVHVTAAGEM